MGRAPLWCHARCAAFALALALACLSGARALSSDVLAVGDVPSANVQKRFPVVGRPRTFPPGPTVTGAVRLGTVRERAFPSRADAAGVLGTDADAFPVDANGPAAREDARGWAEAVVEDVARAGEGAGDAPAPAKTEDAEDAEDVCLTPRRFETEELDLASAVTAMAPALVAALAVSASAALGPRRRRRRRAAAAAARSPVLRVCRAAVSRRRRARSFRPFRQKRDRALHACVRSNRARTGHGTRDRATAPVARGASRASRTAPSPFSGREPFVSSGGSRRGPSRRGTGLARAGTGLAGDALHTATSRAEIVFRRRALWIRDGRGRRRGRRTTSRIVSGCVFGGKHTASAPIDAAAKGGERFAHLALRRHRIRRDERLERGREPGVRFRGGSRGETSRDVAGADDGHLQSGRPPPVNKKPTRASGIKIAVFSNGNSKTSLSI